MTDRIFIASTESGLSWAGRDAGGQWHVERVLPRSDVRCLAADPLTTQRVYAAVRGQGVLRSDDRGKTWRPVGLAGKVVTALAVSPMQQGVVYAGTKPACVFVSRDGGDSWAELDAFRRIPWRWLWLSPAERPFVGYVQAIGLSPTDANRIVVGIEAGATVMSHDGGRSWTRHRRGALRDCHMLTFHATRGNWVYASGGGIGHWGGGAVSRDGGRSWERTRSGLDLSYGWAVAADPGRPEVWYLSAAPGALRAHGEHNAGASIFRNEGTRWRRLSGGLPQPLKHMPYALLSVRDAPGQLFAGLSNGDIWQTTDYGEQWARLPVTLGVVRRALILL